MMLSMSQDNEYLNPMEAEYVRRWRHRGNAGYVSSLYCCPTKKATDLCFLEFANKLVKPGQYDIGGTYTGEQADFWFYYTTSQCPGSNFLLNLFVMPRSPACFTLTVPSSSELSSELKINKVKLAITYGPETDVTLRTTQVDEQVFVKTYVFDAEDIKNLKKCMLLLPMSIKVHDKAQLDTNILMKVKRCHDLSNLMTMKESADFTLESSSGKSYPVHKFVLAAHSPVLRTLVKEQEQTLTLDLSDNSMENLIEILYTGSLKNLDKQDYAQLLDIAERLQLPRLSALTQQVLEEIINIDNAVQIALIAKKYKLEPLICKVFEFIRNNPEVLMTESWYDLRDIILMKRLLQYLHPSNHIG